MLRWKSHGVEPLLQSLILEATLGSDEATVKELLRKVDLSDPYRLDQALFLTLKA
jgi:hypothetical protein